MGNKILVLAPHTDDGELGLGGSINRFIEEGKEVYYAAFSIAENSVPDGFPKNQLAVEVSNATKILGIPPSNLLVYKYEVRMFNYHRQEILEDLIKLRRDINPDIVYIPSLGDIHQDHKTIAEEGCRAFKYSTLLSYEEPWNNLHFQPALFVSLEEKHVKKKMEALKEYKTQTHRSYMNEEFINGLAAIRGTQINSHYAEAFEVIRWIV